VHILFIHQNFPAQFGHIAHYLARRHGARCTFMADNPTDAAFGFMRIQNVDWATCAHKDYCRNSLENAMWVHATDESLSGRSDIQFHLLVTHSIFSSSVFLREEPPTRNWQFWETASCKTWLASIRASVGNGSRRQTSRRANRRRQHVGSKKLHWEILETRVLPSTYPQVMLNPVTLP